MGDGLAPASLPCDGRNEEVNSIPRRLRRVQSAGQVGKQ
jgi:hypothetical protein